MNKVASIYYCLITVENPLKKFQLCPLKKNYKSLREDKKICTRHNFKRKTIGVYPLFCSLIEHTKKAVDWSAKLKLRKKEIKLRGKFQISLSCKSRVYSVSVFKAKASNWKRSRRWVFTISTHWGSYNKIKL